MITILFSVLIIVFAGAFNGSFVTPAKHLNHLPQEKLWLIFSLWGFLIIPILTFTLINTDFIKISLIVNLSYILVPLAGGMIWGIGMVFFSFSFRHIGIGVAFMIDLGVATVLGTTFPLVFFDYHATPVIFKICITLGIILFIVGVVLSGLAAKMRDQIKESSNRLSSGNAMLGIALAVIAGICSAGQGTSFAYSVKGYMQLEGVGHAGLTLACLPWCWIFLGAFVPYVIYFACRNVQRKPRMYYDISSRLLFKTHALIILMAIFFFESVILYSIAARFLGDLGPVVAWPIFMICIVLTANFWSFKYHEWACSGQLAKQLMYIAIVIEILAVCFLSVAAYFS